MIIVGAKGFAREVLETLKLESSERIAFFDDVSKDLRPLIYDKYEVLKSDEEILSFFNKHGCSYALGIGNPKLRKKFQVKFDNLGGLLTSTVSSKSMLGSENIILGVGSNLLANCVISNDVQIGKACIVYYNVVITHDCVIGDFAELSPGATLLGRSKVGDYSKIGANATILPDIVVGINCIVGAGAVVTKDVTDNTVVAGIPAKIIKQNPS